MCSPNPWKASSPTLSILLSSRWRVCSPWILRRAALGNASILFPVRLRDCRFPEKERKEQVSQDFYQRSAVDAVVALCIAAAEVAAAAAVLVIHADVLSADGQGGS